MEKLRKAALLMLGSMHSGEVMAARDAMLRIVELDIHKLATAFTEAVASRGEELSHQETARAILDWALMGRKLSEKERMFVGDMVDWRYPSAKQIDWLRKIYERMRRGNGA